MRTQYDAVFFSFHRAKKISKKMQFLRRRHTDSTLGVMDRDEGARRLTTIEPEEAQGWSKSFNTLLFDKSE